MPDDARTQVLTAATRLFAAQGVGGTSLQEVADAVGIKKQSLLYHFASKDLLHEAVLDALLSRWNETLPALLRAASRQDRFDAILDETFAFFVAEPDRARLLLREALDRPAHMRALLQKYVAPWLTAVKSSIDKGKAAGVFREDVSAEAYVVMVIHLVLGTVATAAATSRLDKGRGKRGDAPSGVPLPLLVEAKRVAKAALLVDAPAEKTTRRSQKTNQKSHQKSSSKTALS
jgi:TetR/AcrR family transcriptional regulator